MATPGLEISAKRARALILGAKAPQGLRVRGELNLSSASGSRFRALPDHLHADLLDLNGHQCDLQLPPGLQAYELLLSNTLIRRLPDDLRVECRLDLSGCTEISELPCGLTVGALVLRGCTSITALPEDLDVWSLDLTGCWALERWPKRAVIRSGRLVLRGCVALRALPAYFGPLASLNVRDCANLRLLPDGLQISGWLDIAHSGLTSEDCLPPSLDRVQLRWGGVNIDRRIAFHPEALSAGEILAETNAERRRVLLDRFGYQRFLRDAMAEVVDEDSDPGGPRQLLRIRMEGDEDLVALSCHCPSTARQYVIRVPPSTPTCRHAAAWIAGFDNPDEYRPLVET
jgi:hypothetical protein